MSVEIVETYSDHSWNLVEDMMGVDKKQERFIPHIYKKRQDLSRLAETSVKYLKGPSVQDTQV
jgi:hypothetical protein